MKIAAKIVFGVVGFLILVFGEAPWWGWLIWLYSLIVM
jgi:hypothetical protein